MAYRKIQGIKFQKNKEGSNGHVNIYSEGNELVDTYANLNKHERIYQTHEESYTKFKNETDNITRKREKSYERRCKNRSKSSERQFSNENIADGRMRETRKKKESKLSLNFERNDLKSDKESNGDGRSKLDRFKKYLTSLALRSPLTRLNSRRALSECEEVYWLVDVLEM